MRVFRQAVYISLLMSVAGCSYVAPETPPAIMREYPDNLPRATVTNFAEALVCFDDLMVIHKSKPVYLSSQGIFNLTSERSLSDGGKEMLISALSHMSTRSKGVRFVAFGSDIRDMLDLQGAHPDKGSFRVPDYFIRGGITQHNKNLWSGQRGAGATVELPGEDSGTGSFSKMGGYGTLALDLSVGHIANLQIVPGAVSANTLAMRSQDSNSVTADLTIGDVGLSYTLSENVAGDFNLVFRALIQVGAIEIIGKLQGLPYWRCLANAGSVVERTKALMARYDSTSEQDRISFIQQSLIDGGYYNGPVNGLEDQATMEAIQTYQRRHNILVTGRANFDVFRLLNLYTPWRETLYVPWWEESRKTGALPGAPYGRAADIAIPISE